MKFKLFASSVILAGVVSSQAFSLDFSGLDVDGSINLSGIPGEQLIISVPDFGNVGFGVLQDGVSTEINDNFGEPAIEFDPARTITVNFFGGAATNVTINFVGLDAGEGVTSSFGPDFVGDFGTIELSNGVAGISGLTFEAKGRIPEPSVSILAALGAVALLRRRR